MPTVQGASNHCRAARGIRQEPIMLHHLREACQARPFRGSACLPVLILAASVSLLPSCGDSGGSDAPVPAFVGGAASPPGDTGTAPGDGEAMLAPGDTAVAPGGGETMGAV